MHRKTANEGARRGVALLWAASMVFSGLIGTLLLGFDGSTALKWCALAALPPLLVLFFARSSAA